MLTTYIVRNKELDTIWQFKYDLNGDYVSFKRLDKALTKSQMKFLFLSGNFPATEATMKDVWMTKAKTVFEIEVGEPDLSFEAFWNLYANKFGKRKMAENTWNRLSKADKIKVFINIPKYKNYLKYYPNQQPMYPTTYLNQEAYKNEWKI